MSKEAIYEKVVEIIQEVSGQDLSVTDELSVQNSFSDSVELMEFIITLEDQFDIEISDKEAEGLQTVSDLVDVISLKK